ncbi:MAG: sulfatase, partial [Bacteroidales bacterium]|nr:sulfatase [Bacteroidales bacterium]
ADEDAPGILTLPGHFRSNGYHTISNGKIFHHDKDAADSWDEIWHPSSSSQSWRDYAIKENILQDTDVARGPAFERAVLHDTIYKDGKTAEKVIRDLRKLKEMEKPFFLTAGFLKPHLPFNAPEKYWKLYDDKVRLPENNYPPENAPAESIHNWGELRAYAGIPSKGPVSDELAKKLTHGYYACVSYTDAQIGKILDELKSLGLDKNTIVVLWGDHGYHLGEHGLWCKHCNFDRVLNAPLMFKTPKTATKGKSSNAVVEFVDIYPTLCELAGIEIPGHLDGISLVPVFEKPESEVKKAAFSRYHDGESVITKNFLYTQWASGGEVVGKMLYDHRSDPKENINVVDDPDYKDVVEELSQLLKENNDKLYSQAEDDTQENGHLMVKNGNFSDPLGPSWRISSTNGAELSAKVEDGQLICDVKSLGEQYWNAGIIQNEISFSLKENSECTIYLSGSCSQEAKVKVQLQEEGPKLVSHDVTLSTSIDNYAVPIQIKEDGTYTLKIYFLDKDVSYFIDDISIKVKK